MNDIWGVAYFVLLIPFLINQRVTIAAPNEHALYVDLVWIDFIYLRTSPTKLTQP